jgi:Fic-DOC domain mobile mystery protein B
MVARPESTAVVGLKRKLTGADLSNTPGQTPLTDEDLEGMIPEHIETREQLNEWEAENIKAAQRTLAARRAALDVLSTDGLIALHKMMFGQTWAWAGEYSKTLSQFSDPRVPRSVQLRELVGNAREMLRTSSRTPEELDDIAVRFHHRLTQIHPWRNGNGRHAREAANEFLKSVGRPAFTWGSAGDLVPKSEIRERYIAALRAADAGDFSLLRSFVRS